MAKHILITGGSGLVGSSLTTLLTSRGYTVSHLSRSADLSGPVKAYAWDYLSGKMDKAALEGVDAIVHLAGAGIADSRWTDQRKKVIVDSRVQTAALLERTCREMNHWPGAFISASGINYYGSATSSHIYTETDPPAESFIGQCCVAWEEAALAFGPHSRVALLRTGVVLSAKGGALPKIDAPVKYGVGAPLGSGKQWMPYVHIDDLCAMYLHAIENPAVEGPYNATSSDHVTNKGLTKAIAKVLGKPLWLPSVPAFALKLVLGEMSEILLEGSRASSEKISETGFNFQYDSLTPALESLYKKA